MRNGVFDTGPRRSVMLGDEERSAILWRIRAQRFARMEGRTFKNRAWIWAANLRLHITRWLFA